jgi:hypothetical protein
MLASRAGFVKASVGAALAKTERLGSAARIR